MSGSARNSNLNIVDNGENYILGLMLKFCKYMQFN